MYKVMVSLWDNDHYDYMDHEYSGILHSTKQAAENEAAQANFFMKHHYYSVIRNVYIEEV